MLKLFFCSLRGHSLVFHRNIYGDEINVSRGRSLYQCDCCKAYFYGHLLHPEPRQIEHDQHTIADLRGRIAACQKLGPWMSAALSDPNVCAEMKEAAQAFLDAVTPQEHDWEQVGDPIGAPLWQCTKCCATTNNAILLSLHKNDCPGKSYARTH